MLELIGVHRESDGLQSGAVKLHRVLYGQWSRHLGSECRYGGVPNKVAGVCRTDGWWSVPWAAMVRFRVLSCGLVTGMFVCLFVFS